MQQMGQNDEAFAKAYNKWYKDVTNKDSDDGGQDKKKKKKKSHSESNSEDSDSDNKKIKRKKEDKKAAKKAEGQWKIYAHAILNIL